MSPGPGPTLITTTSIPQQPQPKNMQQVYHYENTGQPEADQHSTEHQNTNTLSTPNATLANIKEKTPMCLVNELGKSKKVSFLSLFYHYLKFPLIITGIIFFLPISSNLN